MTAEGTDALARHYLEDARRRFESIKKLADDAAAQLSDEEFFRRPGGASNSVAVIFKHVAGNLRSRWTDFLTTDGEKPDRDRESEFDASGEGRADALGRWERGWATLFDALDRLTPADLLRTVTIRHEPHTVVEAVSRQLAHYAYHAGQIVFLAKHLKADGWRYLSVAPGRSARFNAEMEERHKSGG
ncbi:MAG TPA: DUF1572 family protein [Pyrinomonadaceae bacterium]|nr:DUF1572 family protein [Pyrinomonadaceae bacterium]